MTTTVAMPQLGESVVEGTIGKWLVQEGDRVERDQPVVEILTDKADSEVPSPVAGVVVKLLAQEDDVVRVGAGLCRHRRGRDWWQEQGARACRARGCQGRARRRQAAPAPSAPPKADAARRARPAMARPPSPRAPASPSQRKHAREQGLDLSRACLGSRARGVRFEQGSRSRLRPPPGRRPRRLCLARAARRAPSRCRPTWSALATRSSRSRVGAASSPTTWSTRS